MKIKRYLDKDMRHVLRKVREEQGPDAVILSNRRVEDGIEVIAAVDYDHSLVRQALETYSTPKDRADRSPPPLADPEPADEAEPAAAEHAEVVATDLVFNGKPQDDDSLRGMQQDIASLRGLLETQLSGLIWKDTTRRSPARAQVLRNLAQIGVAPDVANIVMDRLEPVEDVRSLWNAPLTELAQLIEVTDDPLINDGGIFALVGPTGVGKTTTIAKIAAHFAMDHWAEDIALISADSYRIGAREHLQAFANIVGVKVYSASDAAELGALLDRLRNKKLILIDTEGRSPRDRELASRLAAWGSNRDRIRFFLTLSAATQEAGLDEAVRVFDKVPLEGCIVTKVDEAAQLGCIISTLIRHGLRASWLSDGQRIPEDLHAASHKKLWLVNKAVDCIEHSRPRIDERGMAERYTRLEAASA